MKDLGDIFDDLRREDERRAKSALHARIRDAITAIEEGDEDEALSILRGLIGE